MPPRPAQGSCAYVVDIQSIRRCGSRHLSVKGTPSLFGPSLALASHPLLLQTTAADDELHVRRTTFEGSSPFYSRKFVYMGLLKYREVGESVFPLFHAWPIDALWSTRHIVYVVLASSR
jgi:hypothetical protein